MDEEDATHTRMVLQNNLHVLNTRIASQVGMPFVLISVCSPRNSVVFRIHESRMLG